MTVVLVVFVGNLIPAGQVTRRGIKRTWADTSAFILSHGTTEFFGGAVGENWCSNTQ